MLQNLKNKNKVLENFTDLKEKGTGKFEKEKRALKNVKHLKISKEKKNGGKLENKTFPIS